MSVVEKYTTIKNPGAYSGISGFKKNNKFSDEEIKKDLLGEDAYTLHVPVIKKFEREKFMVFNIDNTWQIDLADVSYLKNKSLGQNYGFLFCAVDTHGFNQSKQSMPLKPEMLWKRFLKIRKEDPK